MPPPTRTAVSVGDELRRIGYLGPQKPGALKPHAFVELHIEQGPILDEEKVQIGVVESVQGISWIEYTVTGVSNHAGTTPMRLRRDAGYLAASVNLFARKLAWEMGGNQVATVGALSLRPNLINVVPNRAVFTVDLRNTDEARLKEAEARVAAHIAEVAAAERVEVEGRGACALRAGDLRLERSSTASSTTPRRYRSARAACPRARATMRR